MLRVARGPGRRLQRWAKRRPCNTDKEVVKRQCERKSLRQLYAKAHLSCSTSVAERQGRSSRVWRSSTAVPAVTREGIRSTNSSTNAGLFHANIYRHREGMLSSYHVCGRSKGQGLVFTFSKFGKKWVY